ncbi:hypothetical protein [uncultured Exiguobacterium sp.]|uniref:hypothetical protein n=1 Tax=uncultured Exiguobacterium sp. TaxID=202669 RepID=UPI0025D0C2BA|nr:hypothetical protein [uncultured Exiguobacterium sp.]
MKKIFVIVFIGFLFGCSQTDTEDEVSHAIIFIVNNKEYSGTEADVDAFKQQ